MIIILRVIGLSLTFRCRVMLGLFSLAFSYHKEETEDCQDERPPGARPQLHHILHRRGRRPGAGVEPLTSADPSSEVLRAMVCRRMHLSDESSNSHLASPRRLGRPVTGSASNIQRILPLGFFHWMNPILDEWIQYLTNDHRDKIILPDKNDETVIFDQSSFLSWLFFSSSSLDCKSLSLSTLELDFSRSVTQKKRPNEPQTDLKPSSKPDWAKAKPAQEKMKQKREKREKKKWSEIKLNSKLAPQSSWPWNEVNIRPNGTFRKSASETRIELPAWIQLSSTWYEKDLKNSLCCDNWQYFCSEMIFQTALCRYFFLIVVILIARELACVEISCPVRVRLCACKCNGVCVCVSVRLS